MGGGRGSLGCGKFFCFPQKGDGFLGVIPKRKAFFFNFCPSPPKKIRVLKKKKSVAKTGGGMGKL